MMQISLRTLGGNAAGTNTSALNNTFGNTPR
jgi:hypothetical protein